MRWKWFAVAVILVGVGLLMRGAPLVPVLTGFVLAACATYYQSKRA